MCIAKNVGCTTVTKCPQAVAEKGDVTRLQEITMMNDSQITMVHGGQVLFSVGIFCAIVK